MVGSASAPLSPRLTLSEDEVAPAGKDTFLDSPSIALFPRSESKKLSTSFRPVFRS